MKFFALLLSTLLLVIAAACGAQEQASNQSSETEEAKEDKTKPNDDKGFQAGTTGAEVAGAEDERARCEAELYATKGPNATQRWEAVSEAERERMCAQTRGGTVSALPSKTERIKVTKPSDVPDYEIYKETKEGNSKEIFLATDATHEPDMRRVAEDLRYKNQQYDALFIHVRPIGSKGDPDETGSALVFNTRQAALNPGGYSPNDLESLFEEKNGMVVISIEDLQSEIRSKMCGNWDRERLGPPPQQWRCD